MSRVEASVIDGSVLILRFILKDFFNFDNDRDLQPILRAFGYLLEAS